MHLPREQISQLLEAPGRSTVYLVDTFGKSTGYRYTWQEYMLVVHYWKASLRNQLSPLCLFIDLIVIVLQLFVRCRVECICAENLHVLCFALLH